MDVTEHAKRRFLRKVIKPLSDNWCWEWNGAVEKNGYTRAYDGKKMNWGHRVAYMLFVGPIPVGKEIDHLCRNPGCVNPEHLEAVSHRENMRRSPLGYAGVQRRKTHCPQGHPYSGDNLVVWNGMRYCRTCQRRYKQAYKLRKKHEKAEINI